MSSLTGRIIAEKYEIGGELGSGGMGDVYRARHLTLDMDLAVKVLRPETLRDPTIMKRFTREARATSKLKHPNVIQVIDFGETEDGLAYLVLEFVDGILLFNATHDLNVISEKDAVNISIQICEALDEAHTLGIIHRDLKPENVMLIPRRDGTLHVKVFDFGIAKVLDPQTGESHGTRVTRDGLVCGTPEYMPPEQARGHKLDCRSDLYALGIMMYELLARKVPFEAESPVELLTKHILEEPPDIRTHVPNVDEDLATLVMDLIKKNPDERPKNAREVIRRLKLVEKNSSQRIPQNTPTDTAIVTRTDSGNHHKAIPIREAPPHGLERKRETVGTQDIAQAHAQQSVTAASKMPTPTPDEMPTIKPRVLPWVLGVGVLGVIIVALSMVYTHKDKTRPITDQKTTTAKTNEKTEPIVDTHAPKMTPPPPKQMVVKQPVSAAPREVRTQETTEVRQRKYTPTHTHISYEEAAPPQATYEQLMQQAHQAKATSQWKRAIALYKRALRLRRHASLYKEIARAYVKINDNAQACRYFQLFINAHPQDRRADATHRIAHYLKQCN